MSSYNLIDNNAEIMSFHLKFQEFLSDRYPSSRKAFKNEDWQNIIFPEVLAITSKTVAQIRKTVASLYQLKRQAFYLKSLKDKAPNSVCIGHPQDSVLMAFDFHVDSKGTPHLIEVNTNGSGFLIGAALAQYHGLKYKQSLKDLANSFQEEWLKSSKNSLMAPRLTGIIDETPWSQKMIMEFLMYQDFFKTFGWNGTIYDISSLKQDNKGQLRDQNNNLIDFCYNRSTDFYFANTPHLKQSYREKTCAFSPHPTEYFLLSDKNRLCEWSSYKNEWPLLAEIKDNLLNTYKLSSENQDIAFKNRKQYVFKLTGKYGGKGVYRGKNLTSKTFQMLCQNQTVFQAYLPPPLWKDSKGNEWKFDLRAFSYGENVQQIIARCYKGQLTNFKHFGGGMAPVTISDTTENLKIYQTGVI